MSYVFIYKVFIQKIIIKQNVKVKISENDYNEIELKYLKPDKSYLSYNGYKYHRISKIENKSKTIRYRCIGCLSCGLLVKEDKIFSHPSIKDGSDQKIF